MPDSDKTNEKVYTQEDIDKRVNELAEAKIKAIREKEQFERDKAELEKQKEALEIQKQTLEKLQSSKAEGQESPKKSVKKEEAPMPVLNEEQQQKLYQDFQRREYENKLTSFKAQVKNHITEHKTEYSNLSKLKDDQSFNFIINKMTTHKDATGQDMSLPDAVKAVESDVEGMVKSLAPNQGQSPVDLNELSGDDEYMEGLDRKTEAPPEMSQSLEGKGNTSETSDGQEKDFSKIPEGADLVKSSFKKTFIS